MARIHGLGVTHRRPSRRDGLRALVIASMFGLLLLGLPACALFSAGVTTTPLLNSNAPVPSGSGLYSLQSAQETSGSRVTLVRVDAVTGKPQWRQTLPGDISQIVVSDGIIYVDNGLEALALRGSDGTRIWSTTLTASVQTPSNSFVPMAGLPVVADGHVYLSAADGPGSFQPGQVVALRASDGAQLWRRAFDYAPGLNAAGDGLVIVSSPGNGVAALHAADGSLAWQAPYNNSGKDVVQAIDGLVYVDDGPAPLVALDERTGALVWTLPCWKQTRIAPSASGTRIYIGCLQPHNPYAASAGVFAFDTQQRRLLWKYPVSEFIAAPVADSTIVFIPNGTALDAVRASDGKRVWRQQAEEPNAGPVALARIGDTLYVRVSPKYPHVIIWGCGTSCTQREYSLSALRPSDGAAYWRHYEPSETLWLLVAG